MSSRLQRARGSCLKPHPFSFLSHATSPFLIFPSQLPPLQPPPPHRPIPVPPTSATGEGTFLRSASHPKPSRLRVPPVLHDGCRGGGGEGDDVAVGGKQSRFLPAGEAPSLLLGECGHFFQAHYFVEDDEINLYKTWFQCTINRRDPRTASSCFGKAIMPRRCFVVAGGLTWVDGVEEELMELQKTQEQSSGKLKKRPPLRRGKVYPQLSVAEHIPRPSYVGANILQELPAMRQIHNAEGIAGMRAACKLAARVLDFAGTLVKPSVTTNEIDRAVHHMIVEAGAYPSPLGYGGFPKSICTSVNECVCHRLPDSTQLQNGDIINIDVNVFLNVPNPL